MFACPLIGTPPGVKFRFAITIDDGECIEHLSREIEVGGRFSRSTRLWTRSRTRNTSPMVRGVVFAIETEAKHYTSDEVMPGLDEVISNLNDSIYAEKT